ncbi:MAG: hypothetical protein SFV22_10860 [Saprospiraceae bacterium]|nr:hypothetical protein [Saprospiraceae bacterium]
MKKTMSFFLFVSVMLLAACGGAGVSNISEQELPTVLHGEIAKLKNYAVNYEALLAEMEQSLSGGGEKPSSANATPGSVAELYQQFNAAGDRYGVAYMKYTELSQRLQTLSTGLGDGSLTAADAMKELPGITQGLQESAKIMDETKPQLEEIAAKFRQSKGGQ